MTAADGRWSANNRQQGWRLHKTRHHRPACIVSGLTNEKGLADFHLLTLINIGRRGGIRTRDPLHPMQVRYQAALHADKL